MEGRTEKEAESREPNERNGREWLFGALFWVGELMSVYAGSILGNFLLRSDNVLVNYFSNMEANFHGDDVTPVKKSLTSVSRVESQDQRARMTEGDYEERPP